MVFEEIYELYWQKIFRLCMGYVNDSELAQDLAQETFIIVWQQLPKFRNESSIGTWIFRIASNTCLKQIEKEKRFAKADLPIHLEEKNRNPLNPRYSFFISLFQSCRKQIVLLFLWNSRK